MLSKSKQDILDYKDSYHTNCPECKNQFIRLTDDGKDIFTLGKVYWVHYCEMDDNMYSEEIHFCPYCGCKLLKFVPMSSL